MNKRSLGNAYILYKWKNLIDKKKKLCMHRNGIFVNGLNSTSIYL